jgi:hypothetical protein
VVLYMIINVGPQTHSFVIINESMCNLKTSNLSRNHNTTVHLKTSGASIQSYSLHELQNSIKHHRQQNDDSNLDYRYFETK